MEVLLIVLLDLIATKNLLPRDTLSYCINSYHFPDLHKNKSLILKGKEVLWTETSRQTLMQLLNEEIKLAVFQLPRITSFRKLNEI